jgi:nucleoid DNA-binding protein
MATAKKPAAKKVAAKPAAKKPVKPAAVKPAASRKVAEPMTGKPVLSPAPLKPIAAPLKKTGLVEKLAEVSNVETRAVKAVLAALEVVMVASLNKKGAKTFQIPGVLKATTVATPAKPKRKGINPFTKQEVWFAAKPASVKVRLRALKKLNGAIG